MIERTADRLIISAGEHNRTVVAIDRIEDLLPVMHEALLHELERLREKLSNYEPPEGVA